MTPLPENKIERGAGMPTSEIESMDVPNGAGPNNAGKSPQPTRKRARSPGKHEETGLSYHDKRLRLDNATARTGDHEQQRAEVLTRYGASYHLNANGSGVFTINKSTGTIEVPDQVRVEHAQ